MISEDKNHHPLESGIYIIQNAHSNTSINLIASEVGEEPRGCIWKTTKSPTQLWNLEPTEHGYFLRNPSTNRYLSLPDCEQENCIGILGTKRPVEWHIEQVEERFVIKSSSKDNLCIDIKWGGTRDGTHLFLYEYHGGVTEKWIFQRVDDEKPPSYCRQFYIGPVPAGVYWLGQPYEGGGPATANKAPSTAALTVAARFPIKEEATATAHLSSVGFDGLWPNQIWIVEPGIRGYRLKNEATQSYLNYVDKHPVMESAAYGVSAVTEWTIKDPDSDLDRVADWWIRPSSNHDVVLGVSKGDEFNKMRVRPLQEYQQEWNRNWVYTRWRFEPVDPRLLDEN